MNHLRNLMFAAAALVLGGCASNGEKEYTSKGSNNFHIQSAVDKSSGRATFLYIYDVNDKCEKNYLGYIQLEPDKDALDYNLPEGKLMVVTAEFVLGYARNSTEYLIQTQPGQNYYADVRFKGSMYKFTLYEGRGGAKKVVANVPRGGCAFKD